MVGTQILVGGRGWELACVGGGRFPFTKQCFDYGYGVQLFIAGDRRKVLEGAGEDGYIVGDTVVSIKGRLDKV